MASYTFLGNPPPNVQEWIEKTYLTIYKVQTTSSYKKTGIYSALRDDTSKPVRIDWGDGTVEEVNGNVSQKVHEYSDVGEFTVKVSNIKSFAASISNNTWNNTTSQNRYTLKELVNLNRAVTSIVSYAFVSCTALTSVKIPNSVTSIGYSAFRGCSGLTSVTIPDSVTSIGDQAFQDCSSLMSVAIPDSVTSIGWGAFRGCSGLTAVHITDLAKWCSISFSEYNSNPLFYAHNLYLNGVKVTDLIVPDSVTSIGYYAFSGCSGLTTMTIPNSVTNIGYGAFYNCSGLTSVNFDSTTIPIGQYDCFSSTSSLNDVYMLNISVSDVQAQLDSNISKWSLGVNNDGTYHTVTIHCKDGEVVIDPTPSGSSS